MLTNVISPTNRNYKVLQMINLSDSNTVIETIELKDVYTASLYNNSIIEINWHPKLKEVTLSHAEHITETIKTLGNCKRMRLYITTFDFIDFTPESREYSTTKEAEQYTMANAISITSLGKKILFNFYLKFYKPNVPIRAFSTKSQAIDWLLSIRD